MVKLRPQPLRPPHVGSAEAPALLDVPHDGVLQRVPALVEQPAVGELEATRPQHPEDLVRAREVGLRVFHHAAQILEDVTLPVHRRRHARVHGQPPEVPAPGDACPGEVALQRAGEDCTRLGDRDGGAGVGARHGAQHEGGVPDGTGHGTFGGEREPRGDVGPGRDPARGGTQAHDVAEGGRVAQGAAHVRAVGDWEHPAGQRDRRPAARAAARLRWIVGVERLAEDLVEGLGAGAELGSVGLADGDGAGFLETLDH